MKPGDLYRLLHADYGWDEDDITMHEHEVAYGKYLPFIEPWSAGVNMIVEIVAIINTSHVAVWVPQLNGYTIMCYDHIKKL